MNSNSNELDFIYYFNKCLILIENVDVYYQKQILDDIKKTTNDLNNLFSKNYFDSEEKRKNKDRREEKSTAGAARGKKKGRS